MAVKKKEIGELVKNLQDLHNDLIETENRRDSEKICANIALVAELLTRAAREGRPQTWLERLEILRKSKASK